MISGVLAAIYLALAASPSPHSGRLRPHAPRVIQAAADEPVAVQLPPVIGLAGSTIALNIKVPMQGLRMLILREIAADITFSHGFRMGHSWIVGAADIEKLHVKVPAGHELGPIVLDAHFHRSQGAAAARGLMVVSVREARLPAASTQAVGTVFKQELPVERTPRAIGLAAKEEEEELGRGGKLVTSGDIATARLIFQNLALRGSPIAARKLAETYDPQILAKLAVTGLQPDIETARKWYRIASDAGDREASKRLNILTQQ
jgi:hypothetical protein